MEEGGPARDRLHRRWSGGDLEFAEQHLPRAIQIVDLYRARQHLFRNWLANCFPARRPRSNAGCSPEDGQFQGPCMPEALLIRGLGLLVEL